MEHAMNGLRDALPATARTWAQIDLAALRHNFELAQAGGKRVMCVIKADAYGHGAVRCGLYLEKLGADAFAVAALSEALILRENGITRPILLLGHTDASLAQLLAKADLEQTVVDCAAAEKLSQAAAAAGVTVKVHIKLDTGMSRTGLFAQGEAAAREAAKEAARIFALPNLKVCGLYTHFAVADTPAQAEYTAWQLHNYTVAADALAAMGLDVGVRHASNSACIMEHPEACFDMVREGVMLYGMYPDSQPRQNGPLQPVMTLKSRVAQVRELPAGTTIGYGRTYTCPHDSRIAVVLAGYADGHPRRLSNKATVRINGRDYRQVGTICMDMHMVDVTGGEAVRPGDEAVLWGAQGMSAEEAAGIVGTINYELTCLVTQRAPRVYINET